MSNAELIERIDVSLVKLNKQKERHVQSKRIETASEIAYAIQVIKECRQSLSPMRPDAELIEQLKSLSSILGNVPIGEDYEYIEVVDKAIAALSPVLPEEVERQINRIREILGYSKNDPLRPVPSVCEQLELSADLLERQSAQVSGLRTSNTSMHVTNAELQMRIERQEQELAELRDLLAFFDGDRDRDYRDTFLAMRREIDALKSELKYKQLVKK